MDNLKRMKIGWFLRLANLRFEEAPLEEKIRLLRDMQSIFGECLHPDLSSLQASIWNQELAELELPEKEIVLKRLQERLGQFMGELMRKFEETLKYEGRAAAMTFATPAETLELRRLGSLETQVDMKVMLRNKPKFERDPEDRKKWLAFWQEDKVKNSPLEVVVVPRGGDEGFIFYFAAALDGVPIVQLHRCSECKKWILQSGKRPRFFCSSQCRARAANREKRDELRTEGGQAYEEVLEAGRKRARKSYENRMKAKHGHTVKVDHRPRKKGAKED